MKHKMKINKHNYEEFFLLYTDNELNAEDRKEVEDFVEMHPGLKEELKEVLQTRLPLDGSLSFFDKTNLYKPDTADEPINAANYKSYFLLYVDDELTEAERGLVERFIAKHPAEKAMLDLLLQAKLQPETEVIFKDKSQLYRYEKPVVRIAFQWRRMVAAASIILIGGLVWINFNKVKEQFGDNPQRTELVSTATIEKKEVTPTADNRDAVTLNEANHSTENTLQKAPLQGEVKKRREERALRENQGAGKIPDDKRVIATAATSAENENIKPALVQLAVNKPADVPIVFKEEVEDEKKMPNKLRPAVKPVILDEAAFNDEDEDIGSDNTQLALLDTDNAQKKSKGTFRGLLRKASRLVNRATNADGDVAVVRIASFEIAKK